MDMNIDSSVNNDRSRPIDDDRDLGTEVEDRGASRDHPLSVRESLKQSFRDARRDEEPEDEREPREADTRREREVEPAEGQEAEPAEAEEPAEGEEQERAAPRTRTEAAPAAWDKTAKAEWANVPDKVKAAVIKREKDVERGVEHLKQQVHQRYGEIDEAIAPYDQVIRQFNKTPGQAVAQLFAWFDALAKNPDQAFPALLQSYKYDPRRLFQMYGITPQQLQQNGQVQNGQLQNGQAQQPPAGQQPQDQVSPAVQAYINKLEQRLNGFESQVGQQFNGLAQHFSEQSAAKTQDMLDRWSADKPYFNDVRVMMGHLLTPDSASGQAAIPLTADGKVDLDEAYSRACWMTPEIREQMLADQQAQKEAARLAKQQESLRLQQEKAAKARRASGSLNTSAPGAEVSRKSAPGKGLSVRDSLRAAIAEISDR